MSEVIAKPKIVEELLQQALTSEEKQVIVHCCFPASAGFGDLIRIWKSTYLIDNENSHKSELVHAENITFFPVWTEIPPMKDYWFTLIFSGLPKSCKNFDLKEIIPQEGGFFVQNIKRNSSDIYKIRIS